MNGDTLSTVQYNVYPPQGVSLFFPSVKCAKKVFFVFSFSLLAQRVWSVPKGGCGGDRTNVPSHTLFNFSCCYNQNHPKISCLILLVARKRRVSPCAPYNGCTLPPHACTYTQINQELYTGLPVKKLVESLSNKGHLLC